MNALTSPKGCRNDCSLFIITMIDTSESIDQKITFGDVTYIIKFGPRRKQWRVEYQRPGHDAPSRLRNGNSEAWFCTREEAYDYAKVQHDLWIRKSVETGRLIHEEQIARRVWQSKNSFPAGHWYQSDTGNWTIDVDGLRFVAQLYDPRSEGENVTGYKLAVKIVFEEMWQDVRWSDFKLIEYKGYKIEDIQSLAFLYWQLQSEIMQEWPEQKLASYFAKIDCARVAGVRRFGPPKKPPYDPSR